MPFLDVSDVLSDPDFSTSLVLLDRAEVVDTDGFAVSSVVETPFSGVVTSESGRNLQRTPEASRSLGGIMVHTQVTLVEGDEIRWKGATYTVRTVDDYSEYGGGFYAAICDLKPITPP